MRKQMRTFVTTTMTTTTTKTKMNPSRMMTTTSRRRRRNQPNLCRHVHVMACKECRLGVGFVRREPFCAANRRRRYLSMSKRSQKAPSPILPKRLGLPAMHYIIHVTGVAWMLLTRHDEGRLTTTCDAATRMVCRLAWSRLEPRFALPSVNANDVTEKDGDAPGGGLASNEMKLVLGSRQGFDVGALSFCGWTWCCDAGIEQLRRAGAGCERRCSLYSSREEH